MRLTAEVDTAALIRALDRMPARVMVRTKAAAKVTADRIEREMRRRVPVRSGHTREQIRVEEDHARVGYVVLANDPRERTHLELYLEVGTKYMTARPFFYNAARLEEGAHDRRMRAAIAEAIEAEGLGD